MDKKIKVLLICLGVISLLAVGLSAWIYLSAQAEVKEYAAREAALGKQSAYLQEKLDARQRETRHWQERSESTIASLNELGKEHTLLQSQYSSLLRERESLTEKNKTLSLELARLDKLYSESQKKAELGTSDKFLTALLEEKATLEVEIEKLKGRIASGQAQIEDMQKQAQPANKRLAQLTALEEQLTDAQKVSDILSTDLLQERKQRSALKEQLSKAEEQLKSITRDRDELSDQLLTMKDALQQRLAELNQTKKVLESVVEGAKKLAEGREPASIQLSPIVVKAEQQAQRLAVSTKLSRQQIVEEKTFELAGRIITVNDKHRFVVIDIGRDEGVKTGMTFDVYRRHKNVGRIEVIETRKNIAACDIKELSVKHLKVSDIVQTMR